MMQTEYRWLILLLVIWLGACSEQTQHLANGDSAPAFQLPMLAGGESGLALEGKVVAVRFWADWCPFCESEMRAIEPVYQSFKAQGLVILAVNVRQDRETAKAFIDQLGISYDVLLDEDGAVARTFGVSGLPTTFLVGRDGRLAGRILGESTPEVFAELIGKLL